MLKVYGFSRVNKMARGNTGDLRALWALEEMVLPYNVVGMDHPRHDLDTPAYRALKSVRQIPVIDDDGRDPAPPRPQEQQTDTAPTSRAQRRSSAGVSRAGHD